MGLTKWKNALIAVELCLAYLVCSIDLSCLSRSWLYSRLSCLASACSLHCCSFPSYQSYSLKMTLSDPSHCSVVSHVQMAWTGESISPPLLPCGIASITVDVVFYPTCSLPNLLMICLSLLRPTSNYFTFPFDAFTSMFYFTSNFSKTKLRQHTCIYATKNMHT